MIETIQVSGYRSLRDFRLKLGRVTVISGENGTGKSNLYRSLSLLQRAAEGQFAESIAREGGMPGTLWAGERKKHEPRHIAWEVAHADFHFSLTCGLSPTDENSCFRTDPDIKSETIRLGGAKGRVVAERKGPMETQIIVVTHSEPLATSIVELCSGKSIRLIIHEGETRLEGQGDGKRVWVFED